MVGAIAATIAAIGALGASRRQADQAERQVGEAARQTVVSQTALIEADRPWVKIVGRPEVIVQVLPYGAGASGSFRLKNVGHSPAEHVLIHAELITERSIYDEAHEAQLQCDRSRMDDPTPFDALLFPADGPDDNQVFVNDSIISMRTVKEARDSKLQKDFDSDSSINGKEAAEARRQESLSYSLSAGFTLVGCITYIIPVAQMPGQTAFIFGINRACEESPVGLCSFDMTRPKLYTKTAVAVREPIGGAFAR